MDELELPHDLSAERACLGSCMLEGEAAGLALGRLKVSNFYERKHGYIFQAIADVVREDGLPDEIVVAEKLGPKLDIVGGVNYLNELACGVPSAANIERYAEIVLDKAVARYLIAVGSRMQEEARENGAEALSLGLARLDKIVIVQGQDGPTVVSDIMPGVIDEIERRQKDPREVWGIGTGLKAFDSMTGGLHPGLLYIIGARSGMGKSALLTTWFNHICETIPALLFSLEMPKQDIVNRLITLRSGIPFGTLRSGLFPNEQWEDVLKYSAEIDRLRLHIDDSGGITLQQAITRAKLMHAQKGIKIVALDYLQLLSPPKADNREREIATITHSLKTLARSLDVSVILLTQFRKADQSREEKAPHLEDIKGSGAPRQDADVIVFLQRKPDGKGGRSKELDFSIEKQRNGPCGLETIWFENRTMQVMDRNPKGA